MKIMIDQSQILYTQNLELQSTVKTDPEITLMKFLKKYIVFTYSLKFKMHLSLGLGLGLP
jgi:hypothetical protein